MSDIKVLLDKVNEVRYNPAAIQRLSLQTLEEVTNGSLDIVDPSNPFVFMMETAAVIGSSAMANAEALTRQIYPSMAMNEEELYLHMSDKDYISRFASPSRTKFILLFNKEELIQKAVDSEVRGVRKIVIPRNTEFGVADMAFTIEYPIELRVMNHGGIQVVYDVTKPSPLQVMESNMVEWYMVRVENKEYVRVEVPVNQFKVTPYYAQLSLATSYSKSFPIVDQYYHCRVYRKRTNGEWREIRTTHSDQVYDPTEPTVVLKVMNDRLKVTVPQIYVTNGLLSGDIRVDMYTTKGPLDVLLENYEINSFGAAWRDIDNGEELGKYSAPLSTFSDMAVFSDNVVNGGGNALTFEQLRERVITNSLGDSQLPITDVQLSTRLSNMGYTAIKDVDNVTNRIYLATRRLPTPRSGNTIAGAGCVISPLQETYENLSNVRGVIDNGSRLTLTSDVLYKSDNGVIKPLPNEERDELESLSGDELINRVNSSGYLYSPFHQVYDANGDYFETRNYYLDNSSITSKEFIQENPNLGLYVNTSSLSIERIDTGYVLQVITRSGDLVKEMDDEAILPQLSFRPYAEKRDVFLNGVFKGRKGDERVFEFYLESDFDITQNNHILLTNFNMYPNETRSYRVDLNAKYNLVYYVKDYTVEGVADTGLIYQGPEFLLGANVSGVSHERIGLTLGKHLEGFWSNYRTILSGREYRRYEEDIYAYYESNVYERDPVTGSVLISKDVNGNLVYNILHAKGDPVLDSEGNHVIKYRVGDPIRDSDGNLIMLDERTFKRESDLFLVDARYRFVDEISDVNYLKELPETIIGWLDNDISDFRKWTLEQTDLYLYPQRTAGSGRVSILDGEVRYMDLEQSFVVTYYLNNEGYNDSYLREVLRKLAISIISETLSKTRITTNEIISKLTASAGEDVIAIGLEGLGGKLNLPAITLIDNTDRCSIRKRLMRDLDGKYKVIDDIDVVYVRHEV
ncbi:MAG: hypothetical protein IBX57_00340 [Gammaproteobacteria bacterium]|nr:hypothetical protein [Gammaproteobacteria bacterium]